MDALRIFCMLLKNYPPTYSHVLEGIIGITSTKSMLLTAAETRTHPVLLQVRHHHITRTLKIKTQKQ